MTQTFAQRDAVGAVVVFRALHVPVEFHGPDQPHLVSAGDYLGHALKLSEHYRLQKNMLPQLVATIATTGRHEG